MSAGLIPTPTHSMKEDAMSETKETMLVRLKPYNPKRGHNLRRYGYKGIIFDVERGWYKVDAELAEELKGVYQDITEVDEYGNYISPLAFDVCTEEEAAKIDEREADVATTRKTAAKSNVILDLSTKTAQTPASTPASTVETAGLDGEGESEDGEGEGGGDLNSTEVPTANRGGRRRGA
jgi:hypothetical protein